jgi:myo-inositol-1-phosphate synthase
VDVPLAKRAEELVRGAVLPAAVVAAVAGDLAAAETRLRHGISADQPPRRAVATVAGDIVDFRRRHELAGVVVVNVASTEPPPEPDPAHADPAALEAALDTSRPVLPASSLYAYAAYAAGCPYVDFTPSAGGRLPALQRIALDRGLPYAGSDAKTGETAVQSALAPLFAHRALPVLAWSGTNLLGGGDGATLADPAAARGKLASKRAGLDALLGGQPGGRPEGQVHIDHVPALGDWKTAWDHVAFEGFLGVRMALQFTWQGCDSALAAPLVLDLARLVAAAHAAGIGGPVAELGFFFKDPVGCAERRLVAQYDLLRDWAARLPAGDTPW